MHPINPKCKQLGVCLIQACGGMVSTVRRFPGRSSYPLCHPCLPSTQIQVMSAANQPLARASCGTEGFRNAKKGTGIAAQTAGIAAAAVSVFSAPSAACSTCCVAHPWGEFLN